MSTPRRRIIRPSIDATSGNQHKQRLIEKQRQRLDCERAALARWTTRLKRAFTFVEKIQRTIGRLERKITQLEDV